MSLNICGGRFGRTVQLVPKTLEVWREKVKRKQDSSIVQWLGNCEKIKRDPFLHSSTNAFIDFKLAKSLLVRNPPTVLSPLAFGCHHLSSCSWLSILGATWLLDLFQILFDFTKYSFWPGSPPDGLSMMIRPLLTLTRSMETILGSLASTSTWGRNFMVELTSWWQRAYLWLVWFRNSPCTAWWELFCFSILCRSGFSPLIKALPKAKGINNKDNLSMK